MCSKRTSAIDVGTKSTKGVFKRVEICLESRLIYILKQRLLQKEQFHCWVPALVFRHAGKACWQMMCCCINLLQNFSSSSHCRIWTQHANLVDFSLCTFYSGPPLREASKDCQTLRASGLQHHLLNAFEPTNTPRLAPQNVLKSTFKCVFSLMQHTAWRRATWKLLRQHWILMIDFGDSRG